MLVWGHSHIYEVLFLLKYPWFVTWYLCWPCCVSEVHVLLDMCPTQPGHIGVQSIALLSLPVKHKLRLFLGSNYLALQEISKWWTWQSITLQVWGKSIKTQPCMKSCTSSKIYDVQENQPVGWRFDVMVLMLSCYCLLVSCGLLLACPSPPGSAPGGLSFSSWFSSWWLVLLLLVRDYSTLSSSSTSRFQSLFYWFVFWFGGAVLENCGVLLMWGTGQMVASSPGRAHLLQLLTQLGAVVLPAAHSVRRLSCLWAARLFVTPVWSDLSLGRVVKVGLVHKCVIPKVLNRTDTMLDQN
jgi:hypothetical protein